MAAQLGAASSLPRASGRKRSWNADPPAFAKVVRVEPFGVRLEVFGIALGRCPARADNAQAVQRRITLEDCNHCSSVGHRCTAHAESLRHNCRS